MQAKSHRHVLAHKENQGPMAKVPARRFEPPTGVPPRNRKVGIHEARKIIIETAAARLSELTIGSLTLERIAASAGMHKMTICRAFGSRDKFAQVFSEWLCEREAVLWRDALASVGESHQDRLRVFFNTLSIHALNDSYPGWQLHLLASSFPAPDHPVRKELDLHRENFRSVIYRLAGESQISAPRVATDALVLLWDGMLMPLLSMPERERNLEAVLLLVERITCEG
ncbi:hypothetical protein PCAR4_250079 [Paraburkholderia caribensis]|nr:hypothetical protein PCAR4_250079 [Paraburkholderia caribensis]